MIRVRNYIFYPHFLVSLALASRLVMPFYMCFVLSPIFRAYLIYALKCTLLRLIHLYLLCVGDTSRCDGAWACKWSKGSRKASFRPVDQGVPTGREHCSCMPDWSERPVGPLSRGCQGTSWPWPDRSARPVSLSGRNQDRPVPPPPLRRVPGPPWPWPDRSEPMARPVGCLLPGRSGPETHGFKLCVFVPLI